MDYTLSPDYATDAGTGQRMHQDTAAVTTAVTADDMNMVIWSLMAIVKAAGLSGLQFDVTDPATWTVLLNAFKDAGGKISGFQRPDAAAVLRTIYDKLLEQCSVSDLGAVGDGVADDTPSRTASLAISGLVVYPAFGSAAGYKVTSWNGVGGATGAVVRASNSVEADESFIGQGAISVFRETTSSKDAIYTEHYGSGTGYALHGISYADHGSGVGGASWGTGAGVVGNKRGVGAGTDGNGVYGQCGIDGGNGSGVYGLFQGGGAGNAVGGLNQATGSGVALFGWRTGGGSGAGMSLLRDDAGDGQGATVTRTGSGNGDGLNVECSTSGAGSGATVTRKSGSTVWSIGYSAFYDGTQSIGLYGYAPAGGSVQWAGRFDGNVLTSGLTTLGGGAIPLVDGTGDIGASGKRFHTVWATTGTINTSDAREKTPVAPLTDAEVAAATDLAREVGTYQRLDAVEAKGADTARQHVGMTVQRALEILAQHGLDPASYAFICHDVWEERVEPPVMEMREQVGEDGSTSMGFVEVAPARVVPAGDRYGFRETQLALFIARGHAARLDALERAFNAR